MVVATSLGALASLGSSRLPPFSWPSGSKPASRQQQAQAQQQSPASRLRQGLRPLQLDLAGWSKSRIHALDIDKEIEALTRHQKLTGRYKKDRSASDSMDEVGS